MKMKFTGKMASFVAWIAGRFFGGANKSKENKQESESNDEKTAEPSFTITLDCPIEEVIQESITEDKKNTEKVKKRSKKKEKIPNADNIGFSFFATEEFKKTEQEPKRIKSKSKLVEKEAEDNLGFSFLPVKDKKKKPTTKIEESGLIGHNNKIPKKRISEKLESPTRDYVVIDKLSRRQIEGKSNLIEIVNKESGKTVFLQVKESKKVESNVSFASIVKSTTEQSIEEERSEESFEKPSETSTNLIEEAIEAVEIEIVEKKNWKTENDNKVEEEKNSPKKRNPEKMTVGQQIRVLTLNDQDHQTSTIYRLEKSWMIQFRLGPSLLGRKVHLYCNYPKKGEIFKRTTYNLLNWCQDEGCSHSDDTALKIELSLEISGSFHYYFTFSDGNESQGSGFFLVDPVLKYGNNEELLLDCIQCQTVLAKSLGDFSTWENKLRVAKESGYNMIHFTPIQALGGSNSCYSLRDQLKVNPKFGKSTTFSDISNFLARIRTDWKMTSICDIVLNHTANESDWLKFHPEATYNCKNCPYLRPAYLLDAALHQFSLNVQKGVYENRGIPSRDVNNEDHLNSIRYHLHNDVLAKLKLHELYICNVDKYVSKFSDLARKSAPNAVAENTAEPLKLVQDVAFRRLASEIDLNLALKLYNVYRNDCFDEDARLKRSTEEFKQKLLELNQEIINQLNGNLNAAVENCVAGIRYYRVQTDGPKIREISVTKPLVSRYFTDFNAPETVEEHEKTMYETGEYLMAHNGWVMDADPLRNFADSKSSVYIRRELIAWGDSVKLRFGDKPEDCPYLWQHFREYVEQTALMFDGIRLDNCHSTPIPVAEYLLDCARKIKPDLYVVAELFTNSDHTDNVFVNRLGITSLIREAMSAWDSHELGRLVHRYGGCPVGSFSQPQTRPLVPTVAHALFLDLTHDNPSPVEKRSVFDLLPSTALVNMACCASGSTRGYDELVPHHIHVVDEEREYAEWGPDGSIAGNCRFVSGKTGLIAAKKALNDLHFALGVQGFNQVYVDQIDTDIVAITRHCPETHQSYILVAFTAFSYPQEDSAGYQRAIKPLRVEGALDEVALEATLSHISARTCSGKYSKFSDFVQDSKWINGLSEYKVNLRQHISAEESDYLQQTDSGSNNVIQLDFKNFKPGSIVVIKVSLSEQVRDSVRNVRNLIRQFTSSKQSDLNEIIENLKLSDLNRVLYRCDQEEKDEGFGFDTYDIPNFGRLVYAGLQGFMSLLAIIRPQNDLGHQMCANLRDGDWMIDYVWQRLKLDEGTKDLGQWLEENTKDLKKLPRYLIPCYFDVFVTRLYCLLLEKSFSLMSEFVKNGSTFVKSLSLGSLQFAAYIKSADLPVLSPNLQPPQPPQRQTSDGSVQSCVSLSAGLPHFSVGYMRNWGRDTFIALRGLFLLAGRFQEARYHILGYAACLRHGLIPNLLDGGRNPRYNCRDAIWWWAYCIKTYTELVPGGISILSDKVSRIFPQDESAAQPAGKCDQSLSDVIQEALTVHFQGLMFRERNAGRQIDQHMTDKGFNNQIGIHPETGFVFGGNEANCGTWMDKMGSSDRAGNRGKPATPRDGSAIELVGLSKAVVTWLADLVEKQQFPYSGVERLSKKGTKTRWTYREWAQKIQNSFEKHFWISPEPTKDEIHAGLISKRGIYKDSCGSSQRFTDFQLRCNFPIAMVVAPELFTPENAWKALETAEKHLLGPLGMKTLDPDDWTYNGDYDNSNDSNNYNLANGFNYHQGPEWLWPVGFYLRAKLIFGQKTGKLQETVAHVKFVLSRHFTELQTSLWRGLPELTNTNGTFCRDSSRTQAWSMSCILEVLHDLQKIETEDSIVN